ncbi:hypothetical protein SAMN05444383_10186 [Myxococcus xanthus]|nr:hypothetical protein SAMN05444383_10186 [Myxococcus xanthus]
MLNAFRHHGERDEGTRDGGRLRAVLNAFRHHGERDNTPTTRSNATSEGAQRLSASRRAGLQGHTALVLAIDACSTPFGITASGTWKPTARRAAATSCSTPFGITASGTKPSMLALTPFSCSTPFGITASGTRRLQRVSTLHQACSTPFGITASGTGRSAGCSYSEDCAQRLSASRRAGLMTWHRTGVPPRVLNAFRHHGERDGMHCQMVARNALCSTPFGITASGTTRTDTASACASETCSTPFGITASGTDSAPSACRGASAVLNAFRHHGERDSPPESPSNSGTLQTPFKHLPLLPPGWPSQALPRIANPMKPLGFSSIMHLFTCQRASPP